MYIESRLACRTIVITLNYIVLPKRYYIDNFSQAKIAVEESTANWVHLPYDFLATVSNEIIHKVKGVNRVVYDISSKPPATIEWE